MPYAGNEYVRVAAKGGPTELEDAVESLAIITDQILD
jgi:hypothetical protein